jgi:hypothetical protein
MNFSTFGLELERAVEITMIPFGGWLITDNLK